MGDMRSPCASALLLLALAPQVLAQRAGGGPGTGDPREHRPPWHFLQSDVLVHDQPVTLYWIPASLEQVEHSRLMTSEALLAASERCVGLEIVLAERAAVVRKLGDGQPPFAALVGRNGEIVRRGEADQIEKMVSDHLASRDEAMYRDMREAHQATSAGNSAAAIERYRRIWDDRC